MKNRNIIMLEHVATVLEELVNEVVFVGGATACLYAEDLAAPEIVVTEDVDCVIEILNRIEYVKLEERLRAKGFRNDTSEGAPICRWLHSGYIIDIMPTSPEILGFSNIWYEEGIKHSVKYTLPNEATILIFSLPYFFTSKIEALKQRGYVDLRTSQDFEDIIYVLDNRREIIEELSSSNVDVRHYLSSEFGKLNNRSDIREGIACVMFDDSQGRMNRVIDLFESISRI
ncbi:MAG: hypothetical protein KJ607_08095 [Bacteroidetes bacterium]|nr:hypothetical protein [Bacteroidota bacterium]